MPDTKRAWKSQEEPLASPRAPRVLVSPYAYPLDEFYAQASRVLPPIQAVPGEAVPEPYRRLLVHENDMTSTLEGFHGQKIHLEVLTRQQRGDFYFREVVLLLEDNRAVEFGAIKISLALFPPTARRLILEERAPLGRVLNEHSIPHQSRPKAFLRIEPDEFICKALRLSHSQVLFGRRNTLLDPMQRPLAEIVEILPPADPVPSPSHNGKA